MIEMKVASIRQGLQSYQRVVILKEKDGDRHLPIFTDIPAAESIMVGVDGNETPRPLTHDMTLSIIECLGGKVNMAIITKLLNDCFYSNLIINVDNKKVTIDCRPSDAIAVAVRAKVPIFAEEEVLNAASIILKDEGVKEIEGAICTNCGQKTLFVYDDGKIRCKTCGETR